MAQSKSRRLTPIDWVICGVACFGFAFDTYELLVLTLTVQPALTEFLTARPGSAEFNHWIGWMFYIPAIAGGIFGLLGGYLIDRFGRRRVLFWSILLSCSSTLATALFIFRPAIADLSLHHFRRRIGRIRRGHSLARRIFPERDQRETILGFTQIFASTGGILMSGASYLSLSIGPLLPAIHGGHEAWRYTILWGILPAIPLLVVRPFLPESPIWQKKREEGTLQRPSILELFHPEFRKTALLSCFMMACAYAASFGMLQHFARIIPGAPGVRDLAHADQQKIVSALQGVTGGGKPGRANPDGGSGYFYSQPEAPAAHFSDSRLDADSAGCIASMPCETPRMPRLGNFRSWHGVRRPIQFLGKLFADALSDALARHRGKLCRQRRRADAGNIRRPDHDQHRDVHARRHCRAATRLRGGNRRLPRLRRRFHRKFLAPRAARGSNCRVAMRQRLSLLVAQAAACGV